MALFFVSRGVSARVVRYLQKRTTLICGLQDLPPIALRLISRHCRALRCLDIVMQIDEGRLPSAPSAVHQRWLLQLVRQNSETLQQLCADGVLCRADTMDVITACRKIESLDVYTARDCDWTGTKSVAIGSCFCRLTPKPNLQKNWASALLPVQRFILCSFTGQYPMSTFTRLVSCDSLHSSLCSFVRLFVLPLA